MVGDRRRGGGGQRMLAAPGGARTTLLPARLLACVEGYAMVRRPGASTVPFVVPEEEWAEAPPRGQGE